MNDDPAQLSELPTYFGNVLQAMIPLIGFLSFIMILAGGFKILTSGGDPKGMAGGERTDYFSCRWYCPRHCLLVGIGLSQKRYGRRRHSV